MLQQTQASTVVPYFNRFLNRFPTLRQLAKASEDEVLEYWSGLGYYRRARHLRMAALEIVETHNGEVPASVDALARLPGIGRSTAGAIVALAFKRTATILDGNVRRVLSRFYAVKGERGAAKTEKQLWSHAEDNTPAKQVDLYTQAIMDLGATICVRSNPKCSLCPLASKCKAHRQGNEADYPIPAPRRALRVQRARFFMLIDDRGACLLQKRPPNGVWASLWSPPQHPHTTPVSVFIEAIGLSTASIAKTFTGKKFRHAFSHYQLEIEPIYVFLQGSCRGAAQDQNYRWHHPGERAEFGLSAVAVKLLTEIDSDRAS